jgi:transposase-like protein
MALDQSALLELLDALKAADADGVVRHAVEAVFQALIEAEATAQIGAGPHQRTPGRVARRNGYRDRTLTTAAGDLELRIPKLRSGSFFLSLLERRRRIDQVLGFDLGDSESGTFWTAFLRSLRARGLTGVQLVTSDAHTGLKAAIESVLLGATWQRCRIHATRNLLTAVPKGHADMVAAAVRTIFAQPDTAAVRSQPGVIAGMLGRQFPKVEAMLRDARAELTAFADFPAEHWKKVWSTNGLERASKEIKRRTDVVGVFPDPASLLRLAGAVLAEIHDEWQVIDRRILSEASMAKLLEPPADPASEHAAVAIPAAIAS